MEDDEGVFLSVLVPLSLPLISLKPCINPLPPPSLVSSPSRAAPRGPKRVVKTKQKKRGNGMVGVIWGAGWIGNVRNWWWGFGFSLIKG